MQQLLIPVISILGLVATLIIFLRLTILGGWILLLTRFAKAPPIRVAPSTPHMLRANRGEAPFPEFILEREFQCHNTLLIKDIVCKTIQKFVKKPQDVRLSITVAFQPRITAKIASHEHDAIAIIEVDKPGNFYPGGQEQRWRNRELEVLKKVEEDKEKERREMHKMMFGNNEDKTKQKTDLGVKRPPSTTTGKGSLARAAPPPPLKAEIRRLPTGEVYAVRELVGHTAGKTPPASPTRRSPLSGSPVNMDEDKPMNYGPRRPCTEEMMAVRESGERRDDDTDRDGSSMEALDIVSDYEPSIEEKKTTTTYVGLPSINVVKAKESVRKRGSIQLEDDGRSQKVTAYITVE